MKTVFRLAICLFIFWINTANCQSKMVPIKGDTYIPLYGRDSLQVTILDFEMDVYPVTNAQFLEFVKKNSKWQRSQVKKIFADTNYLIYWKSDTTLGENQSQNT